MSAIQQIRPEELKNILLAEFQDRNEPNFAWKSACSLYQGLPGLRGFWPMSSVDYRVAVQAVDLSAQTNHLTNNNVVEFGYDRLAPYADFGGTNEYLSRADGGAANWADITGLETYVLAAQRGLTLGGWFYFDRLATNESCMSKYQTPNQRAYLLRKPVGNTITFTVSGTGADTFTATSTNTVTTGLWYFLAGRFDPSTEVAVWLNSDKDTNVVAIPAAVWDSTAPFLISGINAGATEILDGRASLCFLCAAALSDTLIGAIYQQTRRMFEAT